MVTLTFIASLLALATTISAQCGAGTPDAKVTGSGSSYTATNGATNVYTGSDYGAAIQKALDSITAGQRVSVIASGSLGTGTISIGSGKTFEGCGTINVGTANARGSIQSINTSGVKIPFLTMTGNPYFGLQFSGTKDLTLGKITMNLSGGLGIRFDRDAARNSNTKMDVITVSGGSSHAVEVWNIDGLTIKSVIAKNMGECGLLIQASTDVHVDYVEGNNVGGTTGYATLRFANNNGQKADGSYGTNVNIGKVVSRGGGRGVFCVSQSGAAVIQSVDLANNGNNAVLIENCYNLSILGGTVNGGGEVRLSARSEFPNNKDISITLKVDGTGVVESPCGVNTKWTLTGTGARNICV